MQNSARILVQRYLDGELSDVERHAFLDDLSKDSRLAAMLDDEVQLDVAIISDAYAIEVPDTLRTAVLTRVATTTQIAAPALLQRLSIVSTVFVTTLVTLVTSLAPNDVRLASAVPAEQQHRSQATISAVEAIKPVAVIAAPKAPVAAVDVSQQTDAMIVAEASPVLFTPPSDATVTAQPVPTVIALAALPARSATLASTANLSTFLAPSIIALRYDVGGTAHHRIYVEGGMMQMSRGITQIVNGNATLGVQQNVLPFALIGLEGAMMHLPAIDRSVHASASVGVNSIGPMATADLAIRLAQLGPVALDAGLRMQATLDLRNRNTVATQLLPAIRISLPTP